MDKIKEKLIKKERFKVDSSTLIDELLELKDTLKDFIEDVKKKLALVPEKGDRGEKGEKGDSIKGESGERGEKGEKGDKGERGLTGEKGSKGDKGDNGKDGKDGKNGTNGKDGKDGKDGSPDTLEQTKSKLSKLKDFIVDMVVEVIIKEQRIDISHIRNANPYRKKDRIDFSDMRWHGAGSGGSGSNNKRDNLSSQCDGSNIVFTLSNNYKSGTVQLWSSQFPIVFNPDTDFTETTANTITLVGIVPETNQTLVAIYEVQ